MRPVLVMGVAGSGKTTLARALAVELGRPFVEGDCYHSEESRAKMAAGVALTDEDRAPWLDRLAARMAEGDGPVVACSALKRAYRDRLRQAGPLTLVYCAIDPETARQRLDARQGHYFDPALLPSQFETLEPPGSDEEAFEILSNWSVKQATLAVVGLGGT